MYKTIITNITDKKSFFCNQENSAYRNNQVVQLPESKFFATNTSRFRVNTEDSTSFMEQHNDRLINNFVELLRKKCMQAQGKRLTKNVF